MVFHIVIHNLELIRISIELKNFTRKICNTIQIAVDNANLVKAKHFLSYAAYTISLTLLEKFGRRFSQSYFPFTSKS